METLPNSFWIIFFLCISIALITAIISNARDRLIPFAYITIILSIGTPLFSFLYVVGRSEGSNELNYLFQQIGTGHYPAIILFICYVYLIFWVILFVWDNFGEVFKKYGVLLWRKLKQSRIWLKLRKHGEE